MKLWCRIRWMEEYVTLQAFQSLRTLCPFLEGANIAFNWFTCVHKLADRGSISYGVEHRSRPCWFGS